MCMFDSITFKYAYLINWRLSAHDFIRLSLLMQQFVKSTTLLFGPVIFSLRVRPLTKDDNTDLSMLKWLMG